jgi:triosephosphate isomerase
MPFNSAPSAGCCADVPASRKPLIAGNWKMNLSYGEAVQLSQQVVDRLEKGWKAEVDVLMCPPFTALRGVSNVVAFDRSWALVGAQDVSTEDGGAFTGEVSAAQLADLDCAWCIVGHSERRARFGESNELVAAKCDALARAGISPIVCVGEPLDVYEAGDTVAYVAEQTRRSLSGCTLTGVDLAVAYEPVWAIGSGKVPSPEHVQRVAAAIRAAVAEVRCEKRAASVRVLYGGSVKPGNVAAWMACPDVDGVLVGGDSLKAESFVTIVERAVDAL